MQPHQMRVVEEKEALDEKINKLTAFMDTPLFNSLPTSEQDRLARQGYHMGRYSQVLGERIAAFQ